MSKKKKENLTHPVGWGENPDEPESLTSEMIPEDSGHEKVQEEKKNIPQGIESHPKFSKFKSESHKGE